MTQRKFQQISERCTRINKNNIYIWFWLKSKTKRLYLTKIYSIIIIASLYDMIWIYTIYELNEVQKALGLIESLLGGFRTIRRQSLVLLETCWIFLDAFRILIRSLGMAPATSAIRVLLELFQYPCLRRISGLYCSRRSPKAQSRFCFTVSQFHKKNERTLEKQREQQHTFFF